MSTYVLTAAPPLDRGRHRSSISTRTWRRVRLATSLSVVGVATVAGVGLGLGGATTSPVSIAAPAPAPASSQVRDVPGVVDDDGSADGPSRGRSHHR